MKLFVAGFLFMSLLTGCYPASEIRVTDNRPMIAIKNTPQNAILYVDGLNMGLASQYSGAPSKDGSEETRVLLIEPGRHRIEVKSNGKILLSEDVFLSESVLKTITLNQK